MVLADFLIATATVKTVVADLAKLSGEEIAAAIAGATEGIDVGLLVNNAGMASLPKYFHEVDRELTESMLRVNVNAAVWATKGVIDGMLKRKRGAILNMGSGSTVYISSFPLLNLYASTKAFLATFSKSISLEYEGQGIDIQCQAPLFVATKMTRMNRWYVFIPSAKMFSRASVRWIGYNRVCNPYWSHSVQAFVARTMDTIIVWGLECYAKWLRARERSRR
ncbi:very-long-chain 3-oxoacyl-CoA reductase 1-like [Eucalyptus grandis]|uniref:very-long-chain 3-oxoacyl-CoA reductase 1-like n=1 Tax=Eucalyptus grandis TaxID=71139 RepID=UPI00192EABC3|nr:very-long-chain 3-oxoacyl-CoA reductase 1-like [Eucalyptus grandis]